MFKWSDDNRVPAAPLPSMKAPPRSARMEEQSMGGAAVPQQHAMGVPEQQVGGALERQAEEVPEQQARGALERRAEERPMAETVGPPPQDVGVDPKATAGSLGRHHRFKKLYRQTKP